MKNIKHLVAGGLLVLSSLAQAHDHDHNDHNSALGQPGDAKAVSRTVEITMSDAMRFMPSSVSVQRNETIRFVLKNEGALKHEMVLGTIKELKEHAALMIKFPAMEHSDPNQASVQPGQTGELVWKFTQAGTFDFACLQPGHYDAGMKGQVVVAQASAAGAADMTDGVVRKIDRETKKITIKHGDIKNLGMPGMTMVFAVSDPALLDRVKPGDKVKFTAEMNGSAIVVTDIQAAP